MRSTATGALVVLLVLGLAGCDELSDFLSVDPEDLLTVSASPPSVYADGASRASVTARVPGSSQEDARFVSFTTDMGGFVGADCDPDIDFDCDPLLGLLRTTEVLVNIDGSAVAQLQAGTRQGTAIVRAAVDSEGLAQTLGIDFKQAPPQRIDVDPGTSYLSVDLLESTVVTATLRRSQGLASAGTPVDFHALDPWGNPRGFFQGATPSDAEGVAEAIYSPGETPYRGRVSIVARVKDVETGNVIEGRADVELID